VGFARSPNIHGVFCRACPQNGPFLPSTLARTQSRTRRPRRWAALAGRTGVDLIPTATSSMMAPLAPDGAKMSNLYPPRVSITVDVVEPLETITVCVWSNPTCRQQVAQAALVDRQEIAQVRERVRRTATIRPEPPRGITLHGRPPGAAAFAVDPWFVLCALSFARPPTSRNACSTTARASARSGTSRGAGRRWQGSRRFVSTSASGSPPSLGFATASNVIVAPAA
jgi:hypothetical protein